MHPVLTAEYAAAHHTRLLREAESARLAAATRASRRQTTDQPSPVRHRSIVTMLWRRAPAS